MRTTCRWGSAFGLALLTAACGSSDAPGAGENAQPIKRLPMPENEFNPVELEATVDDLVTEINEGPIEPMQMTVLLKALGGFFAPITTGANRAMGELGVTGNVVGPPFQMGDQQEKMALQNQQIEQTVADGAEGIGISPFGDANAAAIDEAVAKGVDVVTLDSDLATSKRSIYVGTLSASAGQMAAKTLLGMLPPAPGTVVIHGNTDPTWSDGLARTDGARRALEEAGYRTAVRSVTWQEGGEAADIASLSELIETADPPAVGVLGLFSVSYWCAMAAEAADRLDLPVVAFDFDPKTVDYMREGRIRATHVQRQYYAGYLVPYILYGIKRLGLEATTKILAPRMTENGRFNIGLDVVPAGKVGAYNDFLASIGATQ
ncbi:substrate-binding domain-containing protein [Sorangium sp. So ce1335]|uniref:substrate-binding domain-containing protein n=1 Tax=Sorangium sp. So ce1335 TaxID=3133335 RepID=UPI003F5DF29C